MSEIITDKYYLDRDHTIAADSFEELLNQYPEIACDHPDHTVHDEWRAMPTNQWNEWIETGVKPVRVGRV